MGQTILIKTLPCGATLSVWQSATGKSRCYLIRTVDDEVFEIWDTSKFHQSALLEAIVIENTYKYKEKRLTNL